LIVYSDHITPNKSIKVMTLNELILSQEASFFLIDQELAIAKGLLSASRSEIYDFAVLDIHKSNTKMDFMQIVASTLQFPDYFGNNWSALYDSLTDKIWHLKNTGYLLIFQPADKLLENEKSEVVNLLETLQDACIVLKKECNLNLKIVFLVENAKNTLLGSEFVTHNIACKVISQA
jgi:RNAse (barnase) inhibitor barstar